MAQRVFISYRREDTAPAAGRVYDRLCRLLSRSEVFFDVTTIIGGENFEQKIIAEIERSDTVLVFIGKKWLEPQPDGGKPRMWEPGDYVRAELRAALARTILVLPVLVDGARMPAPDLLPDDVRAIATRNALLLRHESFDDDTENVVAAVLGVSAKERLWDAKGKLGVKIAFAVAGAVAGLVVLAIGALVHSLVLARPLSASIGDAATTLLLIVAALAGAAAGWRYEARRRRRRR